MKAMLPLGFVVGLALSLARVPVPVLSPAEPVAAPSAAPTVTDAFTEPVPTDPATAATGLPTAPTATEIPLEDATAAPGGDAPPPSETTVQVLDGAGDGARARAVVDVLEEMGYRVVATNPAIPYTETTILYTEGHLASAEALRERDPRFSQIKPNENLSAAVDIHVVVGTDWEV